jgi:hypothetical protein
MFKELASVRVGKVDANEEIANLLNKFNITPDDLLSTDPGYVQAKRAELARRQDAVQQQAEQARMHQLQLQQQEESLRQQQEALHAEQARMQQLQLQQQEESLRQQQEALHAQQHVAWQQQEALHAQQHVAWQQQQQQAEAASHAQVYSSYFSSRISAIAGGPVQPPAPVSGSYHFEACCGETKCTII